MVSKLRTTVIIGCLAVAISLGCASYNSVGASQMRPANTIDGSEPKAMSKPFMIPEASLPKGFPPPGPIGKLVIKEYPSYRLARIDADKAGGGQGAMFQPLFNHIKRNEIAMTAPVEMEYAKQADEKPGIRDQSKGTPNAESMAFLYRETSLGSTGPDPKDERVRVADVPPMTVVSIGVRGDYTDANFAKAVDKLYDWAAAHRDRVRVVGPPRYLGYNSPFVPWFLRYAEVQIPIKMLERPNDVAGNG